MSNGRSFATNHCRGINQVCVMGMEEWYCLQVFFYFYFIYYFILFHQVRVMGLEEWWYYLHQVFLFCELYIRFRPFQHQSKYSPLYFTSFLSLDSDSLVNFSDGSIVLANHGLDLSGVPPPVSELPPRPYSTLPAPTGTPVPTTCRDPTQIFPYPGAVRFGTTPASYQAYQLLPEQAARFLNG